jgi:two-component system sensor histidine kinase HydH
VIGVVEVYRLPHALFRAIAKGQRIVWGSAIAGGLFLYGALFWIVRRASQVIQRQQEQLVESETMAAVGEMASAMAHNLRNPLAAIRSSAEVATEEGAATLLREYAQDIIATVDRLEQWIRDLLTYARPLQHTPTPVQIISIIQETLKHFQTDLTQQGIKLVLDTNEPLPPLQADASLLQQACHSLIANAIEAMPDGGTLTISPRRSTDWNGVQLHISDTGPGISKDHMDKVFRPFFTTKPKGVGVGLTLAKRIVERHGGTIEFTIEDGRGTTVSLFLPFTE